MTAPVLSNPASSQAAQAGLVIAAGAAVDAAFSQLDTQRLNTSLPDFTALIAALVQRYGLASSAMAQRYYKQARAAAGVAGAYQATVAPQPGLRQIGQSVAYATRGLWSQQPDLQTAHTQVVGTVERLIQQPGRDTILTNVHRDPKAHGWARTTEPSPCYFCALLATRGAVYKTQQTGGFDAHDHCRCHPEPNFGQWRPDDRVQEWRQLYRDATTGGNSAKTQREWRQAFTQQYGTPTA